MNQQKEYRINRKKMLYLALLAVFLIVTGFVVVSTKLFYPYHAIIGFSVIILSIIGFIFSIRSYFRILQKIQSLNTLQQFILEYKGWISIVLAILLILLIALTIVPMTKNPFKSMTPDEVHQKVQEDLDSASIILDHLELTGDALVDSGLLLKEAFAVEEREKLKKLWKNFLLASYEAEYMANMHSYFHFISVLSAPMDHAKSFMIAYGLYLKKIEVVSRIINAVQSNEAAKKVLNEKLADLELSNLYKDMAENYYHPQTILRVNIGQAYLLTLIDKIYAKDIEDSRFIALSEEAKKDYITLRDRLGDTVINSAKVGSEKIEKAFFSLWFPIQKNAAKALGHTYLSRRETKFITLPQIAEMKAKMEPGDIMLQRRNWYASNIGIPGFWAHAALYTGTLEDMNKYFSELFPFEGAASFSEYLETNYPEVFNKFSQLTDGFKQAVIEGKEPGIILQPLEVSAMADYVSVLRPKLDKKDKMLSLLRSFGNFGKPYDFNFDFETRDAMVCSELVYDAYQPSNIKTGLNFILSILNGRKIMAPVDMAKKFKEEYGTGKAELDFITFLDGNEEMQKAEVKGVEEFIKTLDRPKYSFMLE